MKVVWEKRPGRWKVSGESKVYPTKQAALDAAGIIELVEEPVEEPIEELVEEEYIDPLEALRQARKQNGDIQEGFDHDGDNEEQGFSESPH